MTQTDLEKFGKIVRKEFALALKPVEKQLDGLEKRLGGIEKRLDGLEKRLDGLEKRLALLESKVERMEVRLNATFEEVGSLVTKFTKVEDDVMAMRQEFQYHQRILRVMEKSYGIVLDSTSDLKVTQEMLIERLTRIEKHIGL